MELLVSHPFRQEGLYFSEFKATVLPIYACSTPEKQFPSAAANLFHVLNSVLLLMMTSNSNLR